MVYTHGSFLPYTEGYWVRFGTVRLGDYVWCAAGVFLHPGVEIGDNSFVNSRSVVTGAIAAGSVVEGNPAQVVGSMERLRRSMTPARLEAAANHMLRHFVAMVVQGHWSATVTTSGGSYQFTHRGRSYRLAAVGPKQPGLPIGSVDGRNIVLVSLANWQAPAGALTFDLSTGTVRPQNDPVYHELGQFMQRYYGIQFELEEH